MGRVSIKGNRPAGEAGKTAPAAGLATRPTGAVSLPAPRGLSRGMDGTMEMLIQALVTAGRLSLSGDLSGALGWAQEALRLAEASHLFLEQELRLLQAAEAQIRHVWAFDRAYGEGQCPLPWAAEVFRRAAKVVGAFVYCRGDEEAGLLARARLVAMAAGEEAYKRGYC
jgi:hypothetical protein